MGSSVRSKVFNGESASKYSRKSKTYTDLSFSKKQERRHNSQNQMNNGRTKLHYGGAGDGKLLQVMHVVKTKEKNAKEMAEEEEREKKLEQKLKDAEKANNVRRRKSSIKDGGNSTKNK